MASMSLVLLREGGKHKLHNYLPYCFFLLLCCTLLNTSAPLNGGN